MKCHTLNCTAEAQSGSTYCEYCKPKKASSNLDEAKVRVARAQEERDKLHEEIMQKHGALRELDTACKAEKAKDSCAMYNGKAHKLRQNYQKSVAELRLAKSALERERNEAKQAEERPAPSESPVSMEAEVELTATEGGIEISGLPPELQDLQGRSGTGKVIEVRPNGDAVVELDLGPKTSLYAAELQRYKGLCDQIAALPPTYGNPSREEKIAKKARLQLRKRLKAMAPLKSCWFCAGFSINNYESPCRNGKLDEGAVPTDACHVWKIARGEGYLTEECTVAMQEMREEIAAREAAKVPDSEVEPTERNKVTLLPADSGNPTHYEPAAPAPWWEGGPLDTVNGMPWHVAVAKCPVGDVVVLKPGTYEFISDEGGRLSLIIDAPYQVYGPITPDEALLQIIRQPQGPPRPVRARPDDEVDMYIPDELTPSRLEEIYSCALEFGEAERHVGDVDVVIDAAGVRIANHALISIDEARKAVRRAYKERGEDEVSISVNGEPATKSGLMRHIADRIEEAEEERERRKATKQVDLHGHELTLPLGVKETKKVSRSRTYEIENYKLTLKEDDLLQFNQWRPDRKRTFIAIKLRFTPADEDTIYSDMDFDEAACDMEEILNKASFILAVEREREAILMKQLAEMI